MGGVLREDGAPAVGRIDPLAEDRAILPAEAFEVAVLQLDPRSRTLGEKTDLDLGGTVRVALELRVEIPAQYDAAGRVPDQHLAPVALAPVLAGLVPAAALARFDRGRAHVGLADMMGARPPRGDLARERVEGACRRGLDGDGLADGRDGDGRGHLSSSFSGAGPSASWLSRCARNASSPASQNWSSHARTAASPCGSM